MNKITQDMRFKQVVVEYSFTHGVTKAAIVEEGKKKRHTTISWHGLRHGYAQKTHADALIENPRQAQKIVSENLGHHRYKVTRIYLAEENPKKKAQ